MAKQETPDHSSRDHAEFSPSSLKYVAGCSGYTGREGTSDAAEKGTRIHEALEVRDPSALHDEDEVAIYDKIVEEETNFINSFVSGSKFKEINEICVDVALKGTSTWGTCDRLILIEGSERAILADYKTGISVIDPPEDNWQAKAYTVGVFQKYPDIQEITFVFYIPVRNEVLTGVFKRDDLDNLIEELSKVIKKGEEVRPKWESGAPLIAELNPTVNCRFCAFEERCPSLGGLSIEVASRVAEGTIPDGDINDPEDPETLEQLWNVAKIVSNWANRIKSKAVSSAKEGAEFPSLRLKSMGATRSCVDNKKLIEVAESFDFCPEELLNIANFPLRKVADAVGSTAPDGEKGQKANEFLDALEDAEIIKISEERFTLS